jgi:hypothetical protein
MMMTIEAARLLALVIRTSFDRKWLVGSTGSMEQESYLFYIRSRVWPASGHLWSTLGCIDTHIASQ